jgi:ribosome biogenesis GTPase
MTSDHGATGPYSLGQLGWRPFYAQQLTLQDLEAGFPARVSGVHRSRIDVLHEGGEASVTLPGTLLAGGNASVTVGDWVLVESGTDRILRLLERASLIARIAAGSQHDVQPIAANLDTLFVVSSCNADFNLSRLERYLSVALDARIEPVILLTKADLCSDPQQYLDQVAQVARNVAALALNALESATLQVLAPWLGAGQSVAFVGSSGVGKSTLVNTLTVSAQQATAGIREDDARGRHTTTSRQLIAMPGGAWLIDTPGMRELKIGAVESGVSAVFDDVEALASACRYRDCRHQGDEGCALQAAVERGEIDERRVTSYLKLQREAANAARTTRERRERERSLGRMYKAVQDQQRKDKQGR